MNIISWALISASVLLHGYQLFAYWKLGKRADQELFAALADQNTRLSAEHEKTFLEGTRLLAEKLAAAEVKADQTLEEQRVTLEKVYVESTRGLVEQLSDVTREVERAREIASAETAKRERYFEQLAVFEKQRNEAWKNYFDQAIGHGNAQNLMMTTIERFARELQARGGRPQIPKVLYKVREEYLLSHEVPAREALNPKDVIDKSGAEARAQALGDGKALDSLTKE